MIWRWHVRVEKDTSRADFQLIYQNAIQLMLKKYFVFLKIWTNDLDADCVEDYFKSFWLFTNLSSFFKLPIFLRSNSVFVDFHCHSFVMESSLLICIKITCCGTQNRKLTMDQILPHHFDFIHESSYT